MTSEASSKLNGTRGLVERHEPATNRFVVKLQGLGRPKAVQAANLVAVDKKMIEEEEEAVGDMGYPKETLLPVHSPAVSSRLVLPTRKEAKKTSKEPILFAWLQKPPKDDKPRPAANDRATFLEAFDGFTSSMFKDWDSELWQNVLVAGGSVLASILPPDPL